MTEAWHKLAREAGFHTSTDRLRMATTQRPKETIFCGIRIVGSPIMPKGYAALVHDNGTVIFGPNGVWTIPTGLAALAKHEAAK